MMSKNSNPALSPGILLSPGQEGYLAYDPSCEKLYELKPVAALIVELCDGSRSLEEICQLAGPFMDEGRAEEIDRFVAQGLKSGLLTRSGNADPSQREFSVAELSDHVTQLRDKGAVQAAFLCQTRVAELCPKDAQAWFTLGELAHILGRRAEARAAYERCLSLRPKDPELEHFLVALRDEQPPPRVPDACIKQLYQRFAPFYESNVRDELGYQGPERLGDLVRLVMGDAKGLTILDLGCGSGLSGASLKPLAAQMTGIDLSPEMIALAQARGLYDRLDVAEITDWLTKSDAQFDLILACDSLIYFGDLAPVLALVAKQLKPGGVFALSLERGERLSFHLSDSGRYTHHPDYVRQIAADAGLGVTQLTEGFLRMEYGAEVTGLFGAFSKANPIEPSPLE
jgi:predicted TPR repeat methyltransferase